MARVRQAEGDLGMARSPCSTRPNASTSSDFFPNVRPIAALQARVLDRAGRLAEAAAWAREQACRPTTT